MSLRTLIARCLGERDALSVAHEQAAHWQPWLHPINTDSPVGEDPGYDDDFQRMREEVNGYFYARLRHERYLNGQTQLSGISSSATLAPGQVLKVSGGAPQAFTPGAVITGLTTKAARDQSFEATFQAMPYSETVCFRPELKDKPQIAGTVPARVTSPQANDPYAHIDLEGRYRVNFLLDRDSWKVGEESVWLRLARPYAGDTHGLHLPLIAGTEVAIAFEQGDPDRPYIAHALHGSQHADHVTRSMQVDSELNIAHEWMSVTQALQRRLWDLHTDKRGAQDDPAEAFKAWQYIINRNKTRQKSKRTPYAPLVEFYYGEATLKDLD